MHVTDTPGLSPVGKVTAVPSLSFSFYLFVSRKDTLAYPQNSVGLLEKGWGFSAGRLGGDQEREVAAFSGGWERAKGGRDEKAVLRDPLGLSCHPESGRAISAELSWWPCWEAWCSSWAPAPPPGCHCHGQPPVPTQRSEDLAFCPVYPHPVFTSPLKLQSPQSAFLCSLTKKPSAAPSRGK